MTASIFHRYKNTRSACLLDVPFRQEAVGCGTAACRAGFRCYSSPFTECLRSSCLQFSCSGRSHGNQCLHAQTWCGRAPSPPPAAIWRDWLRGRAAIRCPADLSRPDFSTMATSDVSGATSSHGRLFDFRWSRAEMNLYRFLGQIIAAPFSRGDALLVRCARWSKFIVAA